ncbi:MAG: hypothetical protein V8R75_15295 [Oscillospiraceae bacterium]
MRDEFVRAITADGLVKAAAITGRDLVRSGPDKSIPSFLLPQPPWAALCWQPPCWATC